jgi:cobalt-zinc-cadmium efflux system membrane fusion protein
MGNIHLQIITAVIMLVFATGCNTHSDGEEHEEHENHEGHGSDESHKGENETDGMGEVHLSELKFNSLKMKIDTLHKRAMTGVVSANGQLEVPPQHEASVTAIVGGNITSIKVIEGDKVSRGQVLAYLSHPDLTKIQTDYLTAFNKSAYMKQEFERQKRLYEEEIGSGKVFQQTKSEYMSLKGEVKGYEAQLNQLNLSAANIREGEIYSNVPVVSPISGYIEKVMVQVGQYIEPQKTMVKIVNTEHVHADLMVFEKDVHKIKKGQSITFTVQSMPDSELSAKIYSVGKRFEKNPKAIHIHAEIDNKKDYLIPGMYINGKISTSSNKVKALPDGAIIDEDGKPYIFTAEKHQKNGQGEWVFTPIEIRTGATDKGWTEINLLEPLPDSTKVAWNNAYYLISEMKKGEASHSH